MYVQNLNEKLTSRPSPSTPTTNLVLAEFTAGRVPAVCGIGKRLSTTTLAISSNGFFDIGEAGEPEADPEVETEAEAETETETETEKEAGTASMQEMETEMGSETTSGGVLNTTPQVEEKPEEANPPELATFSSCQYWKGF